MAPYGVYVLNDNTGFVNLGTDHDTAEFAVESIFRWWRTIGKNTFPNTDKIYISAYSKSLYFQAESKSGSENDKMAYF